VRLGIGAVIARSGSHPLVRRAWRVILETVQRASRAHAVIVLTSLKAAMSFVFVLSIACVVMGAASHSQLSGEKCPAGSRRTRNKPLRYPRVTAHS